jgi:hypothetical protein
MNQIIINPIDRSHHDGEGGFREQICALYYTGIWKDVYGNEWAKFIKSMFFVCQPGAASMDADNPGRDTHAAWELMDKLIENENVRGFYHTHPQGADGFSSQDLTLINGFAQANGTLPLWHIVQPVHSQALVLCANMIGNKVFLYRMGSFDHDPSDPVLLLPLPPKVEAVRGMSLIDLA